MSPLEIRKTAVCKQAMAQRFAQHKLAKGHMLAVLEADGTGKIYVKVEDFEYPYVDADT